MRLVDADALAAELYKHHTHDDEELEPLIYLADAERVIANAPTVDAIPIGWLIDRANDPERAPLYRRYAQMLYEEWQKEQEAQDG